MAENTAADQGADVEGGKPTEPVDWEAKYNAMREHSRGWEKRAKENEAAAEELEQLKASQMSDEEKRAKEMDDLRAENERYRTAEQRRGWVASVSKETGVPADVLEMFECSDEDDLKSKAEAVADRFRKQTVPVVPGDGIKSDNRGGGKRDFLRETLPANLRR